jgi:hypothetical protein
MTPHLTLTQINILPSVNVRAEQSSRTVWMQWQARVGADTRRVVLQAGHDEWWATHKEAPTRRGAGQSKLQTLRGPLIGSA